MRLAAAHVEGRDGDADVLGRLLVDVGQFQPLVVVLLPRAQCVPRLERRICAVDINIQLKKTTTPLRLTYHLVHSAVHRTERFDLLLKSQ